MSHQVIMLINITKQSINTVQPFLSYILWYNMQLILFNMYLYIHRHHFQTCVHLESVWPMRWMSGAGSVRSLPPGWCTLTPGVAEWTTSRPLRPGNAWKTCQLRKVWLPLVTRGHLESGGEWIMGVPPFPVHWTFWRFLMGWVVLNLDLCTCVCSSRVYQMSKLFIFSPSSGLYTCPLAMTDGAAKVIQVCGKSLKILPFLLFILNNISLTKAVWHQLFWGSVNLVFYV